jgi:ribosomal protein S18 acetylase RimI-like enzyme
MSKTEDWSERFRVRQAESSDYLPVIAVVDEWWGGRHLAPMLPRLFFVHFRQTSFIAEFDDRLAGFLCGFLSQTYPAEAYVHFIGVNPDFRGKGVGRALYERFFAAIGSRSLVRAITSTVNTSSIAFHRAIGFGVERIDRDYSGPGQERVLFAKRLDDQRPSPPGDVRDFR